MVRRRPRAGREREFDTWLADVGRAAREFDGYLGRQIIQPGGPENPDYVIILRFESPADMAAWESSDRFEHWMAAGDALTEGAPMRRRLEGMEAWFRDPAAAAVVAPPKWKMALLLLIVLLPLTWATSRLSVATLPDVPLLARTASLIVSIVLMTWLVMPAVTRMLRGWLFRR